MTKRYSNKYLLMLRREILIILTALGYDHKDIYLKQHILVWERKQKTLYKTFINLIIERHEHVSGALNSIPCPWKPFTKGFEPVLSEK